MKSKIYTNFFLSRVFFNQAKIYLDIFFSLITLCGAMENLLKKNLKPYGLDSPTALSEAIGTSRQYTHMLLAGRYPIGPKVCKKIEKAIRVPWHVIYDWGHSEKEREK